MYDVRVCRGVDVVLDYYLVVVILRLKFRKYNIRNFKVVLRYNIKLF